MQKLGTNVGSEPETKFYNKNIGSSDKLQLMLFTNCIVIFDKLSDIVYRSNVNRGNVCNFFPRCTLKNVAISRAPNLSARWVIFYPIQSQEKTMLKKGMEMTDV